MDALHPHSHPLVRKIESIVTLAEEERVALVRLPMQVQDLRADQDIVRAGDRPSRLCVVLEGMTCRYSITPGGKRQIFSFHIVGETPDLQTLFLKTMDHNLGTITPCKVGFIRHEDLQGFFLRHPRLAGTFWRETLIDGAIFREWMIGLGQRKADARIAHFLCEMITRMRAVGLVDGNTCEWPLSQAEVGDALGLTTVHVNRTIQQLRKAGLITLTKGSLTADDWEGLKTLGEFNTVYLHHAPHAEAA